jgi:hypothetical protein
LRGGGDAFITKLNATGSALVYSTYLGGSGAEGGFFRIALDTAGHAYLAGHTDSVDFPITPGAFQPTFVGNVAAYVSKLDPAGSALVYSTYLGGSSIPIGGSFFKQSISIAVDGAGNAHVAGGTTSNTFRRRRALSSPCSAADLPMLTSRNSTPLVRPFSIRLISAAAGSSKPGASRSTSPAMPT